MKETQRLTRQHSAISFLLNNGGDVLAVQYLAGHSDVRLTTQTYAYVQADALRRAVDVLDRFGLEGKGEDADPAQTEGILRGMGRLPI